MSAHRFKSGQAVTVAAPSKDGPPAARIGATPSGRYHVVRPLPRERGINYYRIKSDRDGHERVVMESELA